MHFTHSLAWFWSSNSHDYDSLSVSNPDCLGVRHMPKSEAEMRRATADLWHVPEVPARMQLSRASTDQVRSLQVVGGSRATSADSECRKDKTLSEILNRIKSLEGKIDDLSIRALFPAATGSTFSTAGTSASSGPVPLGLTGPLGNPIYHVPNTSNTVPRREDHYKYVPSVHQMLGWPILQQVLESIQPKTGVDLSNVARDGPAMLLGLRENSQRLRLEPDGAHAHDLPHGLPMEGEGATSFTIPSLTWDSMQRLCKAYFDTFNMIYPILDRQSFLSEIMTSIVSDGFNEGMASTLALLIAALGEVAIAAVQGVPIHMSNGRPSGIKGGTATRPPGLSLFNEARKRMGFNLADCSLENVQVFALAGYVSGVSLKHALLTSVAACTMELPVATWCVSLSEHQRDKCRRFGHCSHQIRNVGE